MKTRIKKYDVCIQVKRGVSLFLFLSLHLFLYAQHNQRPDTIKQLKYEIDTITGNMVDQPDDSVSEDISSDESGDNTIVEQEFFLRKEFTGGLQDTLKFRRVPGKVIKALREDKAFWYANETFKKREKKKEKASLARPRD